MRKSLYQLYYGVWANSIVAYDPGRPVWEREWDVLVVVDGFRADLMIDLADELEYIVRVDSVHSNVSTSSECIEKNFREEYASVMEHKAYVSGNPHGRPTATASTSSESSSRCGGTSGTMATEPSGRGRQTNEPSTCGTKTTPAG